MTAPLMLNLILREEFLFLLHFVNMLSLKKMPTLLVWILTLKYGIQVFGLLKTNSILLNRWQKLLKDWIFKYGF